MTPRLVDNLAQLLDLAAPRVCLYCRAPAARAALCDGCRDDLPWNREACPGCALPSAGALPCPACMHRTPAFDHAWTAFLLQPPVQKGLWGLKYRGRLEQAALLGGLMAWQLAQRREPLPQLLLPVPLHWRRLLRRGYNQALEIGRVLGRELRIPVPRDALARRRATRDQIGQSAAQRRRNMRGAFRVDAALDGMHVALIDDVMTTGATFEELARACREAGAVRIEAWAVARTP